MHEFLLFFKRLIARAKARLDAVHWAFQRITRKHHASDLDLFLVEDHIARILLPKLEAYRKDAQRVTSLFCGPEPEPSEPWQKIIDEIIYAFRWQLYGSKLWEKWDNGVITVNEQAAAFYRHYFGQDIYVDDPVTGIRRDRNLRDEARVRAQQGFELFGENLMNLSYESFDFSKHPP